jgi:hypothetical protein
MLMRTTVILSNWSGGPGVSVLHFELEDANMIAATAGLIRSAYDGVKGLLLAGITVNTSQEWLQITPATGKLERVHVTPSTPTVVGGGTSGTIPRGTMANVRHNTDGVVEGRRVNGRTFIGPLALGALDTSGNLTSTAQTNFSAMWDGLQDLVEARLMVYHRPREATADRPASAGAAYHVQNSVCLAKPGNLRSRRD